MNYPNLNFWCFLFFQAEDGIRDLVRSRGLGDVYKRQELTASKIHQISPVDVIKSDQKENNESSKNKESTKNSSWDSSPLVPEVDEIPF